MNDSDILVKLERIFEFLSANHSYNRDAQELYYKTILMPYNTPGAKVIALLNQIMSTQSMPKIDSIGKFIKAVSEKKDTLLTFSSFLDFLDSNNSADISYERLYNGLRLNDGWGEKTSSFFTKAIYNLHSGDYDSSLSIWSDVPELSQNEDRLYLPVDSVIIKIFAVFESHKTNFSKINKFLTDLGYTNKDIILWDDLWFWGYFTQKGGEKTREIVYNEGKYWSYQYFIKDVELLKEIKPKAEQFIKLITN